MTRAQADDRWGRDFSRSGSNLEKRRRRPTTESNKTACQPTERYIERERDSILELGLEQLFSPDPGNWIVQLTDSRLARIFILIFSFSFFSIVFFLFFFLKETSLYILYTLRKNLTNKWKRISSSRAREAEREGWKGKRTVRNGEGAV